MGPEGGMTPLTASSPETRQEAVSDIRTGCSDQLPPTPAPTYQWGPRPQLPQLHDGRPLPYVTHDPLPRGQAQACERQLTCVSGLGVMSLNQPLLSLPQTRLSPIWL